MPAGLRSKVWKVQGRAVVLTDRFLPLSTRVMTQIIVKRKKKSNRQATVRNEDIYNLYRDIQTHKNI